MTLSIFLVLLIVFVGTAVRRDQSHSVEGSEPLQFQLTAFGKQHVLNKSIAAADVNDSLREEEAPPFFQSSLLDSSPKLLGKSSDNSEDPFDSNGEEDSDPVIGQIVIGSTGKRYKCMKCLTEDDVGKVWLVRDITANAEELESNAVMKVSHHIHSSMKAIHLTLLCNEVLAMQKCAGSPHVVRLLDKFKDKNGRYYIVMEFLPGGDLLRNIVKRDVSLRTPDVLSLMFYDILRGLAYMHKQGLSHRDMKLNNVWITAEKRAKIANLGSVGDTTTPKTSRVGSRTYMSPELLAGKEYLGPEVDVFALGLILYTMVTGKSAYQLSSLPKQGTDYFPKDYHIRNLLDVPQKIKETIFCTQKEKTMCQPHELETGECRCDISDIMQMTWIQEIAALDPHASDSEARMLSVAMIPLMLVPFML